MVEIHSFWREMRTIFAVFVGIAVMSACRPAGESSASVEVSDSAGVTIVDSHEPKWGKGEAWSVSLEPQISIGVVDGPTITSWVSMAMSWESSTCKCTRL